MPGRSGTVRPTILRGDRGAATAFTLALAIAGFLIGHLNRHQWFTGDEWELLLGRDLSHPTGLLQRHGDHFTTLPAIAYQVLFRTVGLHSYWPYLALVITSHLAIAALLRVVMRRAGVTPWISTAAAGLFAFFGSGWLNLVHGFQITLNGSVLFGLAMLVLADHEGPIGRRDALAVLAGVASLACSATGIPMLVAVAVATFLRRGLRVSFAVVSIPATVFAIWNLLAAPTDHSLPRADLRQTTSYAASMTFDTAQALMQSTAGAVVLLAVLVTGTGLVITSTGTASLRHELAAPAGLLVGAVAFAIVVGFSRGAPTLWGPSPTDVDRYLHVMAALCLPAVAVAADALAERWRPALIGALGLFVVGLPGNIAALSPRPLAQVGDRATVLHLADLAVELGSPRSSKPSLSRGTGAGLVIGPLVDARRDGRVPDPPAGAVAAREAAFLALVLSPSTDGSTEGCRAQELRAPDPIRVERGDRLLVRSSSAVHFERVVDGTRSGHPYTPFSLGTLLALDVRWGPIELHVRTDDPAAELVVCP